MVEEPAPARQRRPEGVENPLPTGARGADVTLSWMSLSTRQSTPQEEKQAMNLMRKNGRGENKASRTRPCLSGLKRGKSLYLMEIAVKYFCPLRARPQFFDLNLNCKLRKSQIHRDTQLGSLLDSRG